MRSTELEYLYDEERMNKRRGAKKLAKILGKEAHRKVGFQYRLFSSVFGDTFSRADLQDAFDDGDREHYRQMIYLEGAKACFKNIPREQCRWAHGIEKEVWEDGWDHFNVLTEDEKIKVAYIMGIMTDKPDVQW